MARDWQKTYLNAAGFPDTPQNRRLLSVWQRYEGGHTKNSARFNYLNTTQNMPGSRSINSVGVKSYRSLQQGAAAWARTLKNGRYADLMQGFKMGDPYKANVIKGLSTWLSGSPDSAAGHTYAQKVLGGTQTASEPTPGAPAPQQPQVDLGLPTAKQSAQAFGQIAQGARPTDIFAQFTKAHFGGNRSSPKVPIAPGVDAQIQGNATDNDIAAIKLAQNYLGTPYSWGGGGAGGPSKGIAQGANTVGFDCSGLIEFVWAKQGIQVGGTTYEQIKRGTAIRPTLKSLRPGDAVFFGDPKSPHHVGMYIGGGKFIESPHTGAVVRISKLAGRHPTAARRYG